jgi:hypothetical protein
MVTDGSLDFGTSGFGLSEFVTIMTNAGHTVATAHRNGSGPNLGNNILDSPVEGV